MFIEYKSQPEQIPNLSATDRNSEKKLFGQNLGPRFLSVFHFFDTGGTHVSQTCLFLHAC